MGRLVSDTGWDARMDKIRKTYLALRTIPKTILFTIRYFGIRRLLRPPVLVSHRVVFRRLGGRVEVPSDATFGAVRLGFGNIRIFDAARSRSVWDNVGTISFMGKATLGHGCRLSVSGQLIFGREFEATAESTICCAESISFGDGCLMSWHVSVMDTDFHSIRDVNGTERARVRPVSVHDSVWICSSATILNEGQRDRVGVCGWGWRSSDRPAHRSEFHPGGESREAHFLYFGVAQVNHTGFRALFPFHGLILCTRSHF